MTGEVWIGLDLGRTRTHICVTDHDGACLLEQSCATTLAEIEASLSSFPLARIRLIAVEAGSELHIVRKLRGRGYPVAIFEARKASRFLAIRRNKTDSGDAKGLSDLARLGANTVSQVHLKSPECQRLRSRLVMRHKFVQLRVTAEAVVRGSLALHGRRITRSSAPGALRAQVEAQLVALQAEEGIDISKDLLPLVAICESMRTFLKRLDLEMERTARRHPVCRQLMQVSGVGPICAISFYTAIEDPRRFHRNADVGAYLGLVPRRYQSGTTSKVLGITRTGNSLTRSHLYTAATVFQMCGPDGALKEWALALRERVGGKRSKVALARKLAIVLLAMWKSGRPFEPWPRANASARDVGADDLPSGSGRLEPDREVAPRARL